MGWVLSMAVVEGLSAEEVAARLEAELAEETIGYSRSGEEAAAGLGVPAVGIHGDGRAVILDDPYDDAPPLEDARLLARLSRATRVVLLQLRERQLRVLSGRLLGRRGHGLADYPLSRGARDRGVSGSWRPAGDLCGQGCAVSSPAGSSGCRRGADLLPGGGRGGAVCLADRHPVRHAWLVAGSPVSGAPARCQGVRVVGT